MWVGETKKGRGRPPASLKINARRVSIKIRWTAEEIEAVKAAAEAAGVDVSRYVRTSALERAGCPFEKRNIKD